MVRALDPEIAARSSPTCARSASATSRSTCRGTAWAVSTRGSCLTAGLLMARRVPAVVLAALALLRSCRPAAVPAAGARRHRRGELHAGRPRFRCRRRTSRIRPAIRFSIALGKLARRSSATVAGADAPAYRVEAQAMAFWSHPGGCAGRFSCFPISFSSFEAACRRRRAGAPSAAPSARMARGALAATLLTRATPLFWLTAGRPMSDVPGLVAGTAAMALLAVGAVAAAGAGAQSGAELRCLAPSRPSSPAAG